MLRLGSAVITLDGKYSQIIYYMVNMKKKPVRAEKSTRFPIKFPRNLPSLPRSRYKRFKKISYENNGMRNVIAAGTVEAEILS